MKKLIILWFVFICMLLGIIFFGSCTSSYNSLKTIDTEKIGTEIQINDTITLSNSCFYDYCNIHNISNNLVDWNYFGERNVENNVKTILYTTFNNDSIYTLQNINNTKYIVIKKYFKKK